MAKKLHFTKPSSTSYTPQWANITFYILFGLLTMIGTWVYSTGLIAEELKPEIQLVITVVTPFLYLIKKALRVKDIDEDEPVGI